MASSKKTKKANGAVSGTRRKPNSGKGRPNKNTASKRSSKQSTPTRLSATTTTAFICAVLFLLLVIVTINPEGAILRLVQNLYLGLFGQAGLYISIPAFLYLTFINAFPKHREVKLRSINTIIFVTVCGCVFHLLVQGQRAAAETDIFKALYIGGRNGVSGGIICGGIAILLRKICGLPFSFIILGIGAVISLLCALEITPSSIMRAIQNRPRDDDKDEEVRKEETATRVVNHIANKNIEHKRQMRERRERAEAEKMAREQKFHDPEDIPDDQSRDQRTVRKAVGNRTAAVKQTSVETPGDLGNSSRRSSIMNTTGQDIETPVGQRIRQEKITKPLRPAVPVAVQADEEFEENAVIGKNTKMPEIPSFVRQENIANTNPPQAAPVAIVSDKTVTPGKVSAKDAAEAAQQVSAEIAMAHSEEDSDYSFPPIELLNVPGCNNADPAEELHRNRELLAETLESFKIDAKISSVTRGPSVTRYEVVLSKGVRLNKLTGSADDIALSLGASGVRIAAVPGKISVVGIEVPNESVTTVSLREVISSKEFNSAKSKSSFSVGKDIAGSCIVGNIAKMPHMLIAGTTGSGKSVCMNSIIISLLYKAKPDEVKLIMVDPKMVELGIYNGIPHLMIPVVTDPKKAAGSLQWAVTEMLRRYKMMSDKGVRDLESYNKLVAKEEGGQTLPQVIIIIDELADLMLVAAKEVEDSICRVAQMGRASGMHLIIATQRPSADVITGLMKANIPSRIAFSVASAMESRIILDTQGAEKLVGRGDMLYAPIGCGKPLRVQGCFVTDGEVEAVAEYVKDKHTVVYDQQVIDDIEKKAQQTGKQPSKASETEPNSAELDGDEMLPQAVDVILETSQASVSMLQRRLKLGYARAARIVDEMEEKGIVGPFQGSKPREILITKEQWEAMKNGQQLSMDDIPPDEGEDAPF